MYIKTNLLKPLHNIGKTNKKYKFTDLHITYTWYKDNDGRKLSLKYFLPDVLSFSNN